MFMPIRKVLKHYRGVKASSKFMFMQHFLEHIRVSGNFKGKMVSIIYLAIYLFFRQRKFLVITLNLYNKHEHKTNLAMHSVHQGGSKRKFIITGGK